MPRARKLFDYPGELFILIRKVNADPTTWITQQCATHAQAMALRALFYNFRSRLHTCPELVALAQQAEHLVFIVVEKQLHIQYKPKKETKI